MKALDAIHYLGTWSYESFWIPMLVWTLLALPPYAFIRLSVRIEPQVKYRISMALLHTLPLGLVSSWLVAASGMLHQAADAMYVVSVLPSFTIDASAGTTDVFRWETTHTAGAAFLVMCLLAGWQGIRLASAFVQLRRYRRSLHVEAPQDVLDLANGLSESLGIQSGFSLAVTETESSPLTFGWRRPVIVIPKSLSSGDLRLALVHELTHVKRRDYVLQWAEQLTGALFYMHPLVALLRREILILREITCDAEVLAYTRERAGYARLLSDYAEPSAHRWSVAVGIQLREHHLKTRLVAMARTLDLQRAVHSKRIAALLSTVLFGLAITALSCSDLLVHPRQEADEAPVAGGPDRSLVLVEDMPELVGGLASIQNNLVYPASAREAGAEGRVIVQFIVDEEGQVVEPVIVRGVHPDLDAAALSAVKSARFKPGRQDGKAVRVKMSLPVTFKLPGADDSSTSIDQMPQLIGGLESIMADVKYPEIARRAGIEGRVIIEFTVDKEGNVRDARIVRGIGAGADEEALRAVRNARFTPGMDKGVPVEVKMALPVTFRLPDSDRKPLVLIEVANDGRIILNGHKVEISDLATAPRGVDESAFVSMRVHENAPADVVREVQNQLRRWALRIEYKSIR